MKFTEQVWDSKRRAWVPQVRKQLLALLVVFSVVCMGASTQVNLASQVQGILPGANGGTGNGFFAVSGPASSLKTMTFPNASATIEYQANKDAASGYAGLSAGTKLTLAEGQEVWGVADLSDYSGKSGSGTTAIGATISTPSSNQCLIWNGSNWVNGSCAGVSYADAEAPTGTIDGSNATFTLANTPTANTLQLYKNGQLMRGGGNDYTLTTNSITYTAGAKPLSGDVHVAYYRF